MEFKVDDHFTPKDIQIIKEWLANEPDTEDEIGFAKYFDSKIKPSIDNEHALVYRKDGVAVGFLVYSKYYDRIVKLDIIDVNPDYRHQGIAKRFVEDYIKYFVSKGIVVAELDGESTYGECLAKSTGFEPITYSDGYCTTLFRKFVETREQNRTEDCRLLLWTEDFYKVKNSEAPIQPTYSWSLNFENDKRPIIQYAYKEYQICIIKDGKFIKPDRVELYLSEDFHKSILYSAYPYIYVDKEIAEKLLKLAEKNM